MKVDLKLRLLAIFTGIVVIYLLITAYVTRLEINKLDERIQSLTIELEAKQNVIDRIIQQDIKQQELNDLIVKRLGA